MSRRPGAGGLTGAGRLAGFVARLAVAAGLAGLAACATPTGGGAGPGVGDADAARSSSPAARRGGGYYLDDGPGDRTPAELASIPDAVPRLEPLLARTARPYSALGRTYTPMSALGPYRERGIASWYGKRYHGQPTSSGERYDMYAMTAAHPTLPIPSYVRVTHIGNGRSVVVRVNDRGPFLQNRLIDLSYAAAAKLGFVQAGSAAVEVELITQFDESPGTTTTAAPPVQRVGAAQAAPVARVAPASESGVASASSVASASGVGSAPGVASVSAAAPAPQRLLVETTYAVGQPAIVQAPRAVEPAAARGSGASSIGEISTPAAPPATPVPAALPAPPAPAAFSAAPAARGFWVQLGAYASAQGAQRALEQFASELQWLGAGLAVYRDGRLHKVQAGPWSRREQALQAAERVRGATSLSPFTVFR